jgi:hypothetical protein
MITQGEFINFLCEKLHQDREETENTISNWNFESIVNAAIMAYDSMPGIGFLSRALRLNAFFSVCRHLDDLVENGTIDIEESQAVLIILRLKKKPFRKAITMFDLMGQTGRFNIRTKIEMPRVAREYLAGIEYMGS